MLMNAVQTKPLYKIAIYGPGGTGKTHIGATSPQPLILLFERHGYETVRTAATMKGVPIPPVLWVRSIGQLSRIQKVLASDLKDPIATMMRDEEIVNEGDLMAAGLDREELVKNLPYTRPETIVIDSLTEAIELLADSIDARGGTETDKSGLTYRKLKAWGPITDKGVRVIRAFRDLPYHVLFICLMNERNHGSDEEPEYRYEPSLPGRQLPKKLVAAVNAMGLVMMRREKDDSGEVHTKRWVQFITPDHIASKVANPLRAREPSDARAWFYALEHKVKIEQSPDEAIVGEDDKEEEDEGGNDARSE